GTQLMIVNQYIDGVTLQQFWENYDVSVDEAIEILRQVLLGIKDLEKNSYSHGDLSLGNIMIDKKGHVFLIDYSKPSSCFEITPEFAAPEVLMGQDPDTYSDLFSVGRILQKICPKIDDRLDLMPLLEPLPLNRKFYESVECEHARSQLAKKVQTLQKKKERSSRTLRWMDNVKRRSSWRESSKGVAVRKWVVAFLAPIYVMGVVSASPEFVDEPSGGVVSVVTSRWYQVVIEGRNLGYTPLNKVFLPEGSYLVQWTSSSDVGERQVEIVTGQHLVLSDSFFDSGRHPKRNR
ncbi:MAG: protein kinase, partial [Bdellovibrionales bacterium]|nr:protein kinase [Bdellovibrionales bacterium]